MEPENLQIIGPDDPRRQAVLQFLTRIEPADTPVNTIHGTIPHDRWLELEAKRMKRTGWPLAIIRNRQGELALAVMRLPKKA
jgi:hypothetical protein